MKVSLADKLKDLRKSKNVSQEKFAEYLGVSFQAVSKSALGYKRIFVSCKYF